MKAEGSRQKAEGSKQTAPLTRRLLTVHCSLPTAFYLQSLSLSPVGRALLVAVILVSIYALVRYWRSLEGRPRNVKLSLLCLRAVTLALLSCALAGLVVEYDAATRARILLRSTRSTVSGAGVEDVRAGVHEGTARQVVSALEKKGFEVVRQDSEGGAASWRGEGFVAAAVLTDGAMSAEEARDEVERASARAGGAPVYVIADSGVSEEATVALESVTVAGRSLRGVPVAVRCTVHARGMQGRESLLTISDDAKVQASARLVWTTSNEHQAVTLMVVPKVAGWIDYTAKVEAASAEDALAQRERPFSLYVEERPTRVLFFEAEPTWEAKFIRRALEETGLFEVDYFAQVSRAATVGVSEGVEEKSAEKTGEIDVARSTKSAGAPEARLHAILQNAASLNAYECVIVGATENGFLSASEISRLNLWVDRRGGGLIVLGGNSFNGSIAAPGGRLYTLLPAEISSQSFSAQAQTVSQGRPLEAEKMGAGIALTPTGAGAGGPLRGYLSAREEAGEKVAKLSGQGLRLAALRPSAAVLAVAGQPGASGTENAGAPLIVAMRYGAGRTLLFAPADSWRMRTGASDQEDGASGPFGALWQGIVLWMSEGARPAAEIILSDESPAEGGSTLAEIHVRDASFAAARIEKLSARLQPLTDEIVDASAMDAEPQELAFAPTSPDRTVWRARVPLRARGRFAIEADYVANGKTGSVEKRFSVVRATPLETGAASDTLRRASRETGGDFLASPVEIEALIERLAAASSSKETIRRTWELRTWWPLAIIIPLLLSIEWFARRWWKED
ncbi:MAG TPA: hypothetical protein VF791_09630 [Pyrinomonadaceae bacterium]